MFNFVTTIIRNALQFGGGYLAADGLATQDDVTSAVGAVSTIIAFAWSVYNAYKKKKAEEK